MCLRLCWWTVSSFLFFFLCMPSKATNPSLPLLCFDYLPAWRVVFMGSYYSGQLNIEGVLSKVYIYTYVCLQLYLESPMISTKREWTKMGRGGDREAEQMCLWFSSHHYFCFVFHYGVFPLFISLFFRFDFPLVRLVETLGRLNMIL